MKETTRYKTNVECQWKLVDAEGKNVGRLATKIADMLRGKDRPTYSPHVDGGDYIVVINAEKIAISGDKENSKLYRHHSGYKGGLREIPLAKMRLTKPDHILRHAVQGMLPKNKLRKQMLGRLKIFAGAEHTHEAQNPQPVELN